MRTARPGNLALYVHIPFCSTKCGYCHFNTYQGLERLFAPFTCALRREIEQYARSLRTDWRIRSIFFGGGTPTYLPLDNFLSLLQLLRERFTWEDDVEITSEANPESAHEDFLMAIREAGVNRISFGAQSFDPTLLKFLDREHTVAQIGDAVRAARAAGFSNLNLDLMYGLPFQTMDVWQHSLEQAIALEPEHLSLYALTIDEGTAFKKRVDHKFLPEPDPDLAADLYLFAGERLEGAGYCQYEISNWARREVTRQPGSPNAESLTPPCASRHNLTYWLNQPFIGFGPGAHSYFSRERFWNVLPPRDYIRKIEAGASAVAGREVIGTALERAETVILGLRLTRGVSRAEFAERFGASLNDVFGTALKQCCEWGLLDDDEERMCLTTRGRLLSNEVFQRLLP